MMELSDRVDLERALGVVGLTLQVVVELCGSILAAGRAYLVGSLASGLGNRGSDVDIHVLSPDVDQPSPPFLLFADNTPVDIEHYPAAMPARLLAEAAGAPVVELPVGPIGAGPPISRRARRTASRWLSALPLRSEDPPIFSEEEKAQLLPTLVRVALEQLLLTWAGARLADRSGAAGTDPPEAAAFLWSRAGRELLELRCRAQGDVTTSEKWLPSRAERAGFHRTFVRAHYAATGEAELADLLADTGLAGIDPWQIATLAPVPGLRTIKLGREQRVLNRHGRVLAEALTTSGTFGEVVSLVPAGRLLRALRDGELRSEVPTESLMGGLSG